jgi:hypothetical protein
MRADEGVLIKYIWLFGTSLADKTAAKMIRADQGCSGMTVRKFGAVLEGDRGYGHCI